MLILGAGYLGKRLPTQLRAYFDKPQVILTSRHEKSLTYFDLAQESSWENLDEVDATVWTFPAQPQMLVDKFLDQYQSRLGRLVVIGSTGGFSTEQEDERVWEESPRDLSQERVRGEESIRRQGGILLASAGIYGPQRNPLDWMKEGRVEPSSKYVNLVHIEDLCRFIAAAIEKGRSGSLYIAADNKPMRWSKLFEAWQIDPSRTEKPGTKKSKRVDSSRTIAELDVTLSYNSVLEGIESCD